MTQKYRGVRQATLVSVLEGDGKDNPYKIVEYVVIPTKDGGAISVGKVVEFTQEEKLFIGNENIE